MVCSEDQGGPSQSHTSCTSMDHAILVYSISRSSNSGPNNAPQTRQFIDSSTQQKETSTPKKTQNDSCISIRKTLRKQHIPQRTANNILCAWKPGTHKQYATYIGRWHQFCLRRKVDCLQPNVRIVLDFLTTLYEDGLSYSVINTARCALSQIIIWQKYGTIGAHPLVIKFMKGVFNLRPPVPRYTETWDVGKLLNKFRDMTPTEMLSLKELTLKTVTLVAIVLAARAQTISLLNLNNMKRSNSLFVFMVGKADLKQSRPNYTPPLFKLEAYPDRDICVYTMLTEYIARTSTLRGEGMQLFISYSKPHAKVSAATIARWVKTMMAKADINVHTFKPHSLRATSTSKALGAGVSLPEILHTAGWSSQHTFAKF